MTLFIAKKYVISFVQPYCMWYLGKDLLLRVTNSKFRGGYDYFNCIIYVRILLGMSQID